MDFYASELFKKQKQYENFVKLKSWITYSQGLDFFQRFCGSDFFAR